MLNAQSREKHCETKRKIDKSHACQSINGLICIEFMFIFGEKLT
jgi:hypothetical protein